MKKVTHIGDRKSDHIRINLEEDVRSGLTTGLEHYRFIHEALPEINLSDVDLSQTSVQPADKSASSDLVHDRRHRVCR